jgi:hypothetical protein
MQKDRSSNCNGALNERTKQWHFDFDKISTVTLQDIDGDSIEFPSVFKKRLPPSFSSTGDNGDLVSGPRSRPLSTNTKDSENTTSPFSALARNRRQTAGNFVSASFTMPNSIRPLTSRTMPFGKIPKAPFRFDSLAMPTVD